ncbi:MAG TPA: hypothetical protein VNN09_07600 [Candidatus Competibacteraceae bacterium]|nr:hypothetical protein [Candidatus Competibacteraceae bacterium]
MSITWLLGHARILLAASVFVGVLLPELAALLRPLLSPSILLMLGLALLRLDWRTLWAWRQRPGLVAALLAWLLLASPLLLWGLGHALGLPAVLTLVLVMHAAGPPLTASPVFAQLLGLNPALNVVVLVLATLLLPLTLVPIAAALLGGNGAVDGARLLLHAGLFVALPFLAAGLLRRWLPADWLARQGRRIDAANVLLLLVFAIGIMDGTQDWLRAEPLRVLGWLGLACGMSVLHHGLGYLLFRPCGRETALAAALSAGNRNLALVLAVSGGVLGPLFDLYVAVGQLPIYCMPLLLAPLARRLNAPCAARG